MRIPSNRYVSSNIYRELQAAYDKINGVLVQMPLDLDKELTARQLQNKFLEYLAPKEALQYHCAVAVFTAVACCAGSSTSEVERYLEALTFLMSGRKLIVSEHKFLHKFERLYHIVVPYEQIY